MGARFHGNVMALRAGMKALFIVCDSRTSELTETFNLPSMTVEDFDSKKNLHDYALKADYSSFNSSYAQKFDDFVEFLISNNMQIEDTVRLEF